jgi:hypothetical protein
MKKQYLAFPLIPIGGAKICINDIQYDEPSRTIKIPMKRTEFLGWKKSFFFGKEPVSSEPRIDALLIIRDVVEMNEKVDDILVNECNSCFTVMMGLHVTENELYLGSLEEVRGITLCEIHLWVKSLNFEFFDVEKPH